MWDSLEYGRTLHFKNNLTGQHAKNCCVFFITFILYHQYVAKDIWAVNDIWTSLARCCCLFSSFTRHLLLFHLFQVDTKTGKTKPVVSVPLLLPASGHRLAGCVAHELRKRNRFCTHFVRQIDNPTPPPNSGHHHHLMEIDWLKPTNAYLTRPRLNS